MATTTTDEHAPGDRWIEYRPLHRLMRAPRNPKRHDVAAISASMRRFGYVESITEDSRTGRLVAGHGRLDELEAQRTAGDDPPDGIRVDDAGDWWVPVQCGWRSRSDDEAEAYLVASNFTSELGGWDEQELADLLSDLASRTSLDGTGYDRGRLDNLLAGLAKKNADKNVPDATDPDDEVPPVTQLGDVWQLGEHRLVCGSCTDAAAVDLLFGDEVADFMFTSPPYNVGVDYDEHDDEDGGTWDDYEPLLRGCIEQTMRKLPEGRAIGWNIGVSPKTFLFKQGALIESLGLTFVRQLVWKKVGVAVPLWHNVVSNPVVRNFHPNYQHEVVLVFSHGTLEHGGPAIVDDLVEHDVFTLSQAMASVDLPADTSAGLTGARSNLTRRSRKVHPAPFPVALPQVFVGHFTDRDAIVYEPFCGSGSTIMAAHQAHRRCFAVELSPKYCDVVCERWQRMTGIVPTRNGEPVDFGPALAHTT